jgi:hypothetical protein
MSHENSPKPNLIKQLYFYTVMATSLLFICVGLFAVGNSSLSKFVFPKAYNSYTSSYNSESSCYSATGNQYYVVPYSGKVEQPTPLTEKQTQDCINATKTGIENERESNYQGGMLFGTLTLVISGVVAGGHLSAKKFFLSKE